LLFSQIFFLLPNQILAQGIISVLPFEPTQLNFVEKSNYDSLKTMAQTEPIKIVNTILPENIGSEGIVQVTIPGTSFQYKFKCTLSDYEDANNFVWYGVLQNADGTPSLDRMILVKKDGLLLGDIQVNYLIYKIFPIAEGKQMFFKWPNLTGNITSKPDSEKAEVAQCTVDNGLQCNIRVLIAYTPELLNSSLNSIIVLNAILFIAETNMIFVNSSIKHKLVLADVYRITETPFEQGNVTLTRDYIKSTLTTSSSALSQKRQETKSDVVMVLCKGDWFGDGPQYGQATYGGPSCPGPEILAAALKFSECQGGRRNFNHELGHLFSAMHHCYSTQYSDGFCAPPRAAHTWIKNGVEHFTMMHGVNDGIVRDLIFSNTDFLINGIKPGSADHCNAKGIQECGCEVSANLPNPVCTPTLSVTFNKACKPTKATLKVTNASACGSNLKYEFSHSVNGVIYTTSCPNSINATCDIGFSPALLSGDYLFVRVKIYKVVNGQNQILSTLFKSLTTCTTPLQASDERSENETESPINSSLFPNPANQFISLNFQSAKEEEIAFEIINVGGLVVKSGTFNAQISDLRSGQNYDLPIADIKPGFYLLEIKTSESSKTLKFVKQ
jgi:hypothetical protein